MTVTRIDHVVLYVDDVDAAAEFYAVLLDAEPLEYGDGFRAVRFGEGRLNFRPDVAEAYLVAERPTAGAGDLCLVADEPIGVIERRLEERDVEVVEGPVERRGALGAMTSLYFQDPWGNLVEIAEYHDG